MIKNLWLGTAWSKINEAIEHQSLIHQSSTWTEVYELAKLHAPLHEFQRPCKVNLAKSSLKGKQMRFIAELKRSCLPFKQLRVCYS